MKDIWNKIFNLNKKKFLFSIILTVIFAALLRLFFLEVLDLTLSLGKIDFTNLYFYALVSLFRRVLSIILDELFPHTLSMTLGSHMPEDKPNSVVSM